MQRTETSSPGCRIRRRTLLWGFGAAALPWSARAAKWPDRPVRMLVGFPPGGGPDLLARTLAEALNAEQGWNVLVVNRPGAGGNLAADEVARAAPDGYTILFGHVGALAVNPTLYRKLSFDPLKDFAPVSMLATSPLLVVTSADKPFRSLGDVLKEAGRHPGQVSVGFSGTGTISHLSMTQLAGLSDTKLSFVPYKGASQGMVDVVGGNVDLYVSSVASLLAHVRGGKVRALAITSAHRAPELPDVATVAEQGFPGFDASTWFGMTAPAATPPAIIAELQRGVAAALQSPSVVAKFRADGSMPLSSSPEEFGRFLQAETVRWGKVVREAGVEIQ